MGIVTVFNFLEKYADGAEALVSPLHREHSAKKKNPLAQTLGLLGLITAGTAEYFGRNLSWVASEPAGPYCDWIAQKMGGGSQGENTNHCLDRMLSYRFAGVGFKLIDAFQEHLTNITGMTLVLGATLIGINIFNQLKAKEVMYAKLNAYYLEQSSDLKKNFVVISQSSDFFGKKYLEAVVKLNESIETDLNTLKVKFDLDEREVQKYVKYIKDTCQEILQNSP